MHNKLMMGAAAVLAAGAAASNASADVVVVEFAEPGFFEADVTLTDVAGGVEVSIDINDAVGPGDLFGFFFDIGDECLLPGFNASGANIQAQLFSANNVLKVGQNSNNLNGDGRAKFDGGVQFGSSGAGGASLVTTTSFVLSSSLGDVDVSDFLGQRLGLRVQGTSNAEGSLKLVSLVSVPEPGVGLAGTALLGGLALRRRRRA